MSREGGGSSSGFHPDSFAGSRPQSREWSGAGSNARGGPARRRVTAAEISGAMRARGDRTWGSDVGADSSAGADSAGADSSAGAEFPPRPERPGGKPESAGADSSTEFERETDALLSRAAALMEEEEGIMEDGVMEDGAAEDGVMEDGVMEDGVMEDGVMEDGVMEDHGGWRIMEDGVMEDGVMEDGVMEDGVGGWGGATEEWGPPRRTPREDADGGRRRSPGVEPARADAAAARRRRRRRHLPVRRLLLPPLGG